MEHITYEESLEKIKKLVEKFEKNKSSHAQIDEENTKMQYISPMFEALGWDVYNKAERHYNALEVLFERKVEVKSSKKNKKNGLKAVDYSFRLGGVDKFFVEAKKPSVDIEGDINTAFQIRRYGWSANIPLNILTDFEEFAIYDCRIKPDKKDNATITRKPLIRYTDYEKKWKEIWDLFSKEAVDAGALEYYKETKLKGTTTVDKEFLKSIEHWREILARNIALRNPDISEENLNFSVQKIIDRIIFLRICESRGIEADETLKNTTDNDNTYENLIKLFKTADDKYNSGLFHFTQEKQRDALIDIITPNIDIDGKVLKSIIDDLYYPNPYEFEVFPADILGNVYEQFLGKVIIHKENSKTAKVEDKPEVRKAGGVYYTPSYIVDYIVKNTIGEKVKGKTPKEVDVLKIMDPACGSGSFLIVAYQYLLDWYLAYYLDNDAEKWTRGNNPKLFNSKNGLQLTLYERKRILLNNIYGVDLDAQAVEVTKLSLLLKVLEYEGDEVKQQSLFEERVLPDLYTNIKCGNSIVGTDILSGTLDLEISKLKKIKPFDWNVEFKDIMEEGGFDCVIGNPPYFNIQTLGANSTIANYIQNKYSDIWMDKSDILFYFIAKGLMISKEYVSYIVSNAFLMGAKSVRLRNYILEYATIEKIVNFEQYLVFDVDISTAIFSLNKLKKNIPSKVLNLTNKIYPKDYITEKLFDNGSYFDIQFQKDSLFALVDDRIRNLNDKIDENKKKLRDLLKIGKGMETASNPTFSFKEFPQHLPKEFIKKRITNSNISRYYIGKEKEYLLYFEHIENFEALPIEIQEHLNNHKKELKNRATVKDEGRIWWRYSRPMHKEYYHLNKIWTSYRNTHNAFVYDDTNDYIGLTNTTVIFDTNKNLDLKYVLGLLNSSLLNFRYRSIGKQTGGGSFEYFERGVGELPIVEADKETQLKIIELVEKMIVFQQHYHVSTSIQDKPLLGKQIQALDKEIDNIVYQLYNLTDEEIRIVEGG